MTFRDIDYILELAQTQNFNRAAENLYTAQPTFSYHIKAVEEELGFRIFTGTSKGAVLTPAGAQFCVIIKYFHMKIDSDNLLCYNFTKTGKYVLNTPLK